jgi:hypothetical protein
MRHAWGLGPILLALGACATEPSRDLFPLSGVVRGTVTAAAQMPVARAQVVAVATYRLANGNTLPLIGSAGTDAHGAYVLVLTAGNLPNETVSTTLTVQVAGAEVARAPAPVWIPLTAAAPHDTVLVDLVVAQ